ncbi:hypothetical protein bcgnr5390_17300 [Bacillus luti]|nr:hypothetical protein BC2903_54560 [Bacillus cereus]
MQIDMFQYIEEMTKGKLTILSRIIRTIARKGEPTGLRTLYDSVNQMIKEEGGKPVADETIRARVYECENLERVAKGVYWFKQEESNALLIEGDGRDLSALEDESIDSIITDHPYELTAHKGGNRNMVDYEVFKYTQEDFNEKARVLKPGGVLVEFMAELCTEEVLDYVQEMRTFAKKAGLHMYSAVNWIKEGTSNNQGRKKKNMEVIFFFTKGKCRPLRLDKKKMKVLGGEHKMAMLEMLPTSFLYSQTHVSKRVHKAEKPISLLLEILSYVVKPGEIVLDQFSGGGRIIEAAIKYGCNIIAIEKDRKYIRSMVERISRLTEHVTTVLAH